MKLILGRFNALAKEVEAIVNSGTRVDINYYINEVLDEDHQDEVFDYFKDDAETELWLKKYVMKTRNIDASQFTTK